MSAATGVPLGGLPPGGAAQSAAITLGYGGAPARAAAARSGYHRLRCASLLKPLYAWAAAHCHAPYLADGERWRRDAEPAVRRSDNPATLRLWYAPGPGVILDEVRRRTGVTWREPAADPLWFGGVEVSAEEVVTAYGALALAAAGGDPAAKAVLSWMREVEPEQGFGVPGAVAGVLGLGADEVAVKCGWYGAADEAWLRTHAVAVAPVRHRVAVVAALTALPYPGETARERYRAKVAHGVPVIDDHDRLAGTLLRELIIHSLTGLGGDHTG